MKDQAIFDYATEYYYSHEVSNWEQFRFTDSDFENFIQFLKNNDFDYETDTEKEFEDALRRANDDQLEKDIAPAYNDLMRAIDDSKEKQLYAKKDEIKTLLSDEILKRYFYSDGLYEYHVKNSPEILEAVSGSTRLKYTLWLSSEKGRMAADSLLDLAKDHIDIKSKETEVFICGPQAMLVSLGHQFMDLGIKPARIFYEDFNML